MLERDAVAALLADVASYHITDSSMRKSQERMTRALANPSPLPQTELREYLRAVETYFHGYEREARSHLADLERRLARASQVAFNLTAERGVAVKRVEITQGVLRAVREITRG